MQIPEANETVSPRFVLLFLAESFGRMAGTVDITIDRVWVDVPKYYDLVLRSLVSHSLEGRNVTHLWLSLIVAHMNQSTGQARQVDRTFLSAISLRIRRILRKENHWQTNILFSSAWSIDEFCRMPSWVSALTLETF